MKKYIHNIMVDISSFSEGLSSVFLFILIISGNYLGTLFPCRVQTHMKHSVLLRHIIGFFTIAFMGVLSFKDQMTQFSINILFAYSLIAYIFFLLLSKTPTVIWIPTFMLLAFIYIEELKFKNVILLSKNKEKETILYKTKQTILGCIILILTIFGFIIYIGERKYQYKKKFSYTKILFGNTPCSKDIGYINILNALKHVFD